VLLLIAAEQKEDLGLEGVAAAVAVEIAQEGVFLEDFQEQVGGESRMDETGKRGFADADDTFDGNEHEQLLLSEK